MAMVSMVPGVPEGAGINQELIEISPIIPWDIGSVAIYLRMQTQDLKVLQHIEVFIGFCCCIPLYTCIPDF